ncbi:MAG: hypothetical protein B9J98_00370 [Candidatus Terraquivivens tikiterensis]|uniref:Uncharacterized protein n=1 Tax=Candidatus Terraquivivens tikiterensis TaxID=1980982 RepID=A0A2R7YA12_9ARCH|nr:MAG: hypothetical protein B9J98_00370 [Candidatus Terraquivivens tikiterensis]
MGKRKFVDFWIRPNDADALKEMCKRAFELGYSALVVEVPKNMSEGLESSFYEYGLEFYKKAVVSARTRGDVLEAAARLRHNYDVLTVHCLTRDAALVALRDGRVDTVAFRPNGFMAFDRHMLSVTRNPIELTLADATSDKATLQKIRALVQFINLKGLSVVFSSCASKPVEQKGPLEVACLLNVLGLNFERSLDALSSIPSNILARNRAKLSGKMLQEGVWLAED